MLTLAAHGQYLHGWVLTVFFCWISTGTPPACPVLGRGAMSEGSHQDENCPHKSLEGPNSSFRNPCTHTQPFPSERGSPAPLTSYHGWGMGLQHQSLGPRAGKSREEGSVSSPMSPVPPCCSAFAPCPQVLVAPPQRGWLPSLLCRGCPGQSPAQELLPAGHQDGTFRRWPSWWHHSNCKDESIYLCI